MDKLDAGLVCSFVLIALGMVLFVVPVLPKGSPSRAHLRTDCVKVAFKLVYLLLSLLDVF